LLLGGVELDDAQRSRTVFGLLHLAVGGVKRAFEKAIKLGAILGERHAFITA